MIKACEHGIHDPTLCGSCIRDKTIADLTEALREVVRQKHYEGFGDAPDRAAYCRIVASRALTKAGL